MPDLLVGKYEILECLGTGGAGNVHRAVQYPLERAVALKLLRPELGLNPSVRRRFAREARAVASLNHPHITTVYDFGIAGDGTLYLCMEFIDGPSLRQLIQEGVPTIPALVTVEQILSGLAHAHARGLIHRDLKPANVLVANIDDKLQAKIVDFGIAAVAGGDSNDSRADGKVVGTPSYMSPEQAQGERNLTAATDIYNVGLILYEMAAGRHPFSAQTPQSMMLQHCTAPVPRPLPRPGFLLPNPLENIILRCLEKDPSDRYRSAADCRAAIFEVRRSLEDTGRPIFLPVAPAAQGDATGRITLVEGTARVVSGGNLKVSQALDVPFVGRDQERRFLLEVCQKAIERQAGALVVLEGEAGAGKTRLATWLKEYISEKGEMRCFAGTYLRERRDALLGIREIIDQLFGTRGLDTASASSRIVSQMMSLGMRDAKEAGTLIQMIRPPEEGDEQEGSPQHSHQSVFPIVSSVLRTAAESEPLLLILDDIQWGGAQTVEFLVYLVRELRKTAAPIVTICTLRSEDLAANPSLSEGVSNLAVYEHDIVFRKRLPRMSDSELATLVGHVLPAHDSLVQPLVDRSDGNPLFALQVLRYLIDEDLLEMTESGQYAPTEGIKVEETVPPNLADLLLLRLVQLERRYGEDVPVVAVLERAAVLGSRFPYDALAHMATNDPSLKDADLDSLTDTLLNEGLFIEAKGVQEDLLDFNHTLIRDILLKRMAPRRGTRKLHILAAEAKRTYFGDREEIVAEQLSAHYELGRDLANALKYAHLAGVTAERMHRPADAVSSWKRYLRLCGRVDAENSSELPSPATVRVRVGELQEALGRYEEGAETLRGLVDTSQVPDSDVTLRATLALGSIALKQGQALEAERLFELTNEATAVSGKWRSRALLGLAKVHWHFGKADLARTRGREALDVASQENDGLGQADAFWFLGDVGRLTGELEEAERYFRSAQTQFEAINKPGGVARSLYGLALLARGTGDLESAEILYNQAYATLEPLGVLRGLGHCLNGLGEVARFRNRLTEARSYYKRAVDIYQSAGLTPDATVSLTNLGIVARDLGDLDAAKSAMERALTVAEAADYKYLTLGIAFNLSWVYALLNETDRSRQLLDEYSERCQRTGLVDPDFARPLEGIAGLLDRAGQTQQARKLYQQAQEMWEELNRERDADRVAALLR